MNLLSSGWFYCGQCGPQYEFACCGNTTCNGGGCDQCDNSDERAATVEMIQTETWPEWLDEEAFRRAEMRAELRKRERAERAREWVMRLAELEAA